MVKTPSSPGKAACLALALALPMPLLAAAGPGITAQPQSQSVLTGSNAVFTVVASGQTPLNYQWSFNGTSLANNTHISGATSATLTLNNITTADAGNYQVVVSNSHGSIASSMATLTVLVPAAITAQPTNQTNYFGGSSSFSVSASGTAPLNYRWFFNGTPLTDGGQISGSAAATLTVSSVSPSNIGNYEVIVTNEYGSATSMMATLDATNRVFYVNLNNPNPAAPYTDWSMAATNIQDAVDIAVAGDQILVTNGVYTYANQVTLATTNCVVVTNAISISSVTGPAQTIIDGGGSNRCVYLGGGATLTGFTLTNGSTTVSGGGVWCDSTTDLIVNCSIIGNNGGVSGGFGGGAYQGTLTNCTIADNTAISGGGAWGSVLNNCAVTGNSSAGGGGAAYSTLNDCLVSSNYYISGYGTWGGGAGYCTLNNCTLVGNSATEEGGGAYESTLSNCVLVANIVEEYYGSGGGSESSTLYSCVLSNNVAGNLGGGADSSTLYNCFLSDNTGNVGGGANGSTLYTCLVNDNAAAVEGGGAEGCTLLNCTVVGNSATLGTGAGADNSAVTNSIIYYNFTLGAVANCSGTNGISWCCTTPLPTNGVNNITNAPLFANPDNQFHLLSGSPCIDAGNNAFVTTANDLDGNPRIVNGTVDMGAYEYQNTAMIQIQPLSQTNTIGQTVALSVIATGSALSYQWLFDGTDIAGATNAILTLTNIQLTETGVYSVIVSNALASVNSSNATLTVAYPPPVITSQPQPTNLIIFAGSTAAFSASVLTYSPTVYQWVTNGVPLVDGGRISGSATNLVISNAQISDSGNYELIATNDYGSATSAVVTLTVYPLTSAAVQPPNLTTNGAAIVTLTAAIAGQGPFTYQWQFDGVSLAGATNNALTLSNVLDSQSGAYSVIVGNPAGSVVSSNGMLSVIPWITPSINPSSVIALQGFVVFTLAEGGFSTNATYQWYQNGTSLGGFWLWTSPNSGTDVSPLMTDAGTYYVVGSDPYASVTSSLATLTVIPLAITAQPTNKFTWLGGNARFSVSATGLTPITYQWQFQGVDIPGANTNSLTLTNVQSSQFGAYDVVLANAYTNITSSNANLGLSQVAVWGGNEGETNLTAGLTNIVAIAAGSSSLWDCLALKSNSTVIHWPALNTQVISNVLAIAGERGNEQYYLLETNETVKSLSTYADFTEPVAGYTNIAAIAADLTGTSPMALMTNGAVVIAPFYTGTGSAAVTNVTNAVAIAEGDAFYMALKANGTVTAWGDDINNDTNVPPGLSNVIAIAAGYYHALALKSDGTVAAWGWNAYGQTNVPPGLSNVVAIAAGYGHSLALKADGTVVAWGWNNYGQTNVPPTLTNVIAIAAGQYQSMALIGNGPPIVHVPLSNPASTTNGFTLTFPSQSGRVYILQYINSLSGTNWISQPLVPGNGGPLILTDPSETNQQRFYRVQTW